MQSFVKRRIHMRIELNERVSMGITVGPTPRKSMRALLQSLNREKHQDLQERIIMQGMVRLRTKILLWNMIMDKMIWL